MPRVVQHLREWDVQVDLTHVEAQLIRLSDVENLHDLYVIRSQSELACSLAGALHTVGASMINPYPAMRCLRDRTVASRTLQRAGVPIPEAFVAADPGLLSPLLCKGPLVLKPRYGRGDRGVRVIWDTDQIDSLSRSYGPVFAQRYHDPIGEHLKIYCIGDQFFGVRKTWPARTYEEKLGQPFTITPAQMDIARRCGDAFGLDLYGVTMIASGRQEYVVDVTSFPGFKGVPDASLRVADHIYTAARQVIERGLQGDLCKSIRLVAPIAQEKQA